MDRLNNRVVRVTIPASVAADLGTLQRGIENFVERLGHPKCFSGVDCMFQIERDFVIDPELNVRSVAIGTWPTPEQGGSTVAIDTVPLPERPVRITMATNVAHDLSLIQESVARVVERLGCPECHSGWDMLFRQELEFVANEKAEILSL